MAVARGKVVIGYVHPVEVAAGFHHSLLALMLYDSKNSRRIVNVIPRNSSANISNARNWVVTEFLKTDAEWLWSVDADMTFDPDVIEQLLVNASAEKAPIVGGLCFGVHENALFATLYEFRDDGDGTGPHTVRYDTFPENSMFQVHGTGAACLLIHRTVLEAMQAKQFNKTYPWFQETEFNGQPCGEDVTFCLRAGVLGYPIWVDTGVEIGHQKTYVLTHDMYRQQRASCDA